MQHKKNKENIQMDFCPKSIPFLHVEFSYAKLNSINKLTSIEFWALVEGKNIQELALLLHTILPNSILIHMLTRS
jgi:hypothetical protein